MKVVKRRQYCSLESVMLLMEGEGVGWIRHT